ncbi:MAG: acylphosphatase [Candidatus Tectomicrobia bacterium]|uniref:Acylphosphatase n=1 Tax=Tectimicrobiota bacterium TaxID=2528274 RepID=A0A932ZUR3_UNCTE|nr:acylphosphatase [Candidatus Tectomicrobia bacterium]MBI4252148.1 acylphosphatase [Candidatus Tectomicrobia bacterium]
MRRRAPARKAPVADERVHLLIRGRVQGVWFRASARKEAQALGLAGWARNRPDGAVEVEAEGPSGALDALIAWCRKGPPLARVDEVQIERGGASGELRGFEVR